MTTDERLERIEQQLGALGPKIDAIAARLGMADVDEAISDALAIRGLVAQVNEVIHQQRADLASIASAQTASDAQSENDRADIKTLLTELHGLAYRHAARLSSWERAQLEAAQAGHHD